MEERESESGKERERRHGLPRLISSSSTSTKRHQVGLNHPEDPVKHRLKNVVKNIYRMCREGKCRMETREVQMCVQ